MKYRTTQLLRFMLLLLVLAVVLAPMLVLAQSGTYRAVISVRDTSDAHRTGVVALVPFSTTTAISMGYLGSDGLDSRLFEDGVSRVYMLADDKIGLFVPSLLASQERLYDFETGYTPPSASLAVITGDSGLVTITDHADLEPANNFEIEFEGLVTAASSYPSVEDRVATIGSTYETSHVVNLPSVAIGDLLISFFGGYWTDTGTNTVTWPAGWTRLFTTSSSTERRVSSVAYRIADGSEGATVTVTTTYSTKSIAHTIRITGYLGVPEATVATATGTTSPNPPSLTPSWGGGYKTLWIAGMFAKSSSARTLSSYPTNYSNGLWSRSSAYYWTHMATCFRNLVAASENPGAFTLSGTIDGYAFTVGVQGPPNDIISKADAFRVYRDGDDLVAWMGGASPRTVTASSVPVGDYVVRVWADGTDLGIDIDGVTEDSVALAGASVPNNANNWLISIPYFTYYSHTVGVNHRIQYEPTSYIVGTILPNELSPGTYDGAITWGANTDLDVSIGGLTSIESYKSHGVDEEGVLPGIVVTPGGELFPTEDDPTGLPWYDLVAPASIGLNWDTGTLYSVLYIFAAIAFGVGVLIATGSALLAVFAVGMGLAITSATGTTGWWILLVYAIFATGYLVSARSL